MSELDVEFECSPPEPSQSQNSPNSYALSTYATNCLVVSGVPLRHTPARPCFIIIRSYNSCLAVGGAGACKRMKIARAILWMLVSAFPAAEGFRPAGLAPEGTCRPAPKGTLPTVLRASLAMLRLWSAPLLGVTSGLTVGAGLHQQQHGMLAARAEDRRVVADIPASGLLFKDSLEVIALKDPKVQGVTLYIR
jgi:hypothetical protein